MEQRFGVVLAAYLTVVRAPHHLEQIAKSQLQAQLCHC